MDPWVGVVVVAASIGAIAHLALRRKGNPVRSVEHPFFSRLWLWPPGSHTRWEAEIDGSAPGREEPVGVHAETVHAQAASDVPKEAEIAFCERLLANPHGFFALSELANDRDVRTLVGSDLRHDWRETASLDGFSVPLDGDRTNPWGATFLCAATGYHLNIRFERGTPRLESVDR
ncbi:MAG: hypothetical protein H0X64_08115 [Gemmatimonadaceae bacterium]|nr:hypothetical protein [Gemmatimonadaceae bacterium]